MSIDTTILFILIFFIIFAISAILFVILPCLRNYCDEMQERNGKYSYSTKNIKTKFILHIIKI